MSDTFHTTTSHGVDFMVYGENLEIRLKDKPTVIIYWNDLVEFLNAYPQSGFVSRYGVTTPANTNMP